MSRIGDFFNKIKEILIPNQSKRLTEAHTLDPQLIEQFSGSRIGLYEDPRNYSQACQDYFRNPKNWAEQYNYLDVISQMQRNGALDEFNRYYTEASEKFSSLYYPSQVHGIDHTSRVTLFAEMLCSLDGISAHDRDLILRAAQFHDIGREDDNKNFDHGLASRQKLDQYGILAAYPPRDQEIIKFAVECHSLNPNQIQARLMAIPEADRGSFKMVLDYLQDADKLDRTRIGAPESAKLNPNYLATDTAKKLVKVAHCNFMEFDRLLDYQEAIDEQRKDAGIRTDAFIFYAKRV